MLGNDLMTLGAGDFDADFPYPCAPGLLGSTETEFQMGPLCAGRCPAGPWAPRHQLLKPISVCRTGVPLLTSRF